VAAERAQLRVGLRQVGVETDPAKPRHLMAVLRTGKDQLGDDNLRVHVAQPHLRVVGADVCCGRSP
jgi:hypothetical protein